MNIKALFTSACLALTFSASVMSEPATVFGQWYTIDDESGKKSSLITLAKDEDGKLVGVISKILKEVEDGICDKCPEPFTDQPVEGLQFMWGFSQQEPGLWEGGRLLDPESGDVYKGKVELLDDAEQLEVRGYIGISLFGRSQIWQRVPVVVPEAVESPIAVEE